MPVRIDFEVMFMFHFMQWSEAKAMLKLSEKTAMAENCYLNRLEERNDDDHQEWSSSLYIYIFVYLSMHHCHVTEPNSLQSGKKKAIRFGRSTIFSKEFVSLKLSLDNYLILIRPV